MKRKLSLIFLLAVLLTTAGCKKCYYCHNSCKVCQDAHFTILVQSDVLSTNYYNMYIDSLESLSWTCRDTTFNKDMQVCAQNNKIGNTILLKEESGYTCTPVP
jgi:predicted DNA-binding helix-hairpin-helix protein